jgi:DNA-binding transcriptional regulator YhcF (GntR family)
MVNSDQPRGYRFTDDCRRTLQAARNEAQRLGNSFVAAEHVLLALIADPNSECSRVLLALGLRPPYLRTQLEAELRKKQGEPSYGGPDLPYTSRAKALLEAAMKEANAAGVSTDSPHLLLGILADSRSSAAQLLQRFGATAEDLRHALKGDLTVTHDLQLRIDDRSDTVIYEQIVNQIREAVAVGRLRPGARLPSVRQLADDLGVAPGTVARAYSQLEESGVIVTDGARGTFVAFPKRGSGSAIPVRDLLRSAVIAAFHLGVTATALRKALEEAMADIYRDAA